jgi:hypothetical protein
MKEKFGLLLLTKTGLKNGPLLENLLITRCFGQHIGTCDFELEVSNTKIMIYVTGPVWKSRGANMYCLVHAVSF